MKDSPKLPDPCSADPKRHLEIIDKICHCVPQFPPLESSEVPSKVSETQSHPGKTEPFWMARGEQGEVREGRDKRWVAFIHGDIGPQRNQG